MSLLHSLQFRNQIFCILLQSLVQLVILLLMLIEVNVDCDSRMRLFLNVNNMLSHLMHLRHHHYPLHYFLHQVRDLHDLFKGVTHGD